MFREILGGVYNTPPNSPASELWISVRVPALLKTAVRQKTGERSFVGYWGLVMILAVNNGVSLSLDVLP